jgi:NAD(P)-dependent dehydrogenase (short-subunit alcohol dehydrogenase family)
MRLKNKVAIVTGSANGIGRAIAMEFLKEGAKVVFADYDKKSIDRLAKELKVEKDTYLTCLTDVTNKVEIKRMVESTIEKFNVIDILINHIGDAPILPFKELTDQDFEFSVNITLRSTVWCIKEVLPYMQRNLYGKIINTSSIAGKAGLPNSSFLCMIKHGIIGLTKALALEFGKYNININSVCPALLETKSAKERMIPNFDHIKNYFLQNTPLGRIAKSDEIAKIYVFLASDESEFMTGQAINFTGGFEMR